VYPVDHQLNKSTEFRSGWAKKKKKKEEEEVHVDSLFLTKL
jgi:hypothetical protein